MALFTQLERLSAQQFKRPTGVSRETFALMVAVVAPAIVQRQARGGPRFRMSTEDMIVMALTYWREYRTYFHLGGEYGLSESQCSKIVQLIEQTLVKDTRFHIRGKKDLLNEPRDDTCVIVDVAESPIERPKKKGRKNRQKYHYSGKKKRHTLKAQVVIRSNEVIATAVSNGKRHDFRVFKESKVRLHPRSHLRGDSGYQAKTQLAILFEDRFILA